MLFNSPLYAAFLPLVLALFYASRNRRYRQLLLLVASYVFYAAWDWRFLGLIMLSTIVDFGVAQRLSQTERPSTRLRLLLISVVVNLGVLAAFKYFSFFVDSAVDLLEEIGLTFNPVLLTVALPVGISFYTFQTLSYTIDVYRERIDAESDLATFALFVAFFPQLVAGPIERAERLLPQLSGLAGAAGRQWGTGIQLILLGLFKKVAIADGVSGIVDQIFARPGDMSRVTLILGAVAFAVQIYGDFSGYTDIARGSAKLLGVELVDNFRQPYLSLSVTEFWQRWHISLSNWLRDYLYIPLGGNRRSRAKTYRNLMITMLLGGLWHGAAWSFVLWGALHGVYLVIERVTYQGDVVSSRTSPMWRVITFGLVTAAWIPFRSDGLSATLQYATGIVSGSGQESIAVIELAILAFAVVSTMLLDVRANDNPEQASDPLWSLRPESRGLAYGFATIAGIVLSAGSSPSFIYFQF